jgi:ketosteroid isomerase-like protein
MEQPEARQLELARSIFAAWEAGDYSASGWAHPEIEFRIVGGPVSGTWRGRDGMAEGWRDFLDAFEGFSSGQSEAELVRPGLVLVRAGVTGRGRTSGVDLSRTGTKTGTVFHIDGEQVVRLHFYIDGEEALTDLGLT